MYSHLTYVTGFSEKFFVGWLLAKYVNKMLFLANSLKIFFAETAVPNETKFIVEGS